MIHSHNVKTDRAVIIAAGSGARLRSETNGTPKPLVPVLGVPLLKRVILTARQAGIKEFHVVIGYRGEDIRGAITSDRDLAPLDIRWIENRDWQKANGVSVLKAAESVRGSFVLLMADHLFPADTLTALLEFPRNPEETVLAVDRKIDSIYDLDDGMKVRTRGDGITAIAKDLSTYDAIDTGMFLCSESLFASLRSLHERKGDCSLADGIRSLAEADKMKIFDIGDRWWQDIDTPGSLRHARRLLLRSTQKSTDGVFSRLFNRPVSRLVSRWIAPTTVSPNQVTFANFALAVLAAYLVTFKSYVPFLMGAALFHLTSVLDGVDGEVAKLKFKQSRIGEWVDTITDNLSYLLFFAGVTIGTYRRTPEESVLVLGGLAVLGTLVSLALIYRYVFHQGRGTLLALGMGLEKVLDDCPWFVRVIWKLRFAVKRDFFAILFLALAVAGKPVGILWGGAIATNIVWIVYLLSRAQLWQSTPAVSRTRVER